MYSPICNQRMTTHSHLKVLVIVSVKQNVFGVIILKTKNSFCSFLTDFFLLIIILQFLGNHLKVVFVAKLLRSTCCCAGFSWQIFVVCNIFISSISVLGAPGFKQSRRDIFNCVRTFGVRDLLKPRQFYLLLPKLTLGSGINLHFIELLEKPYFKKEL